ncbi:MAG: hypothetical protein FD180_376 [Planctomycetota bacterium]|nr:MAG: hypothetical protein FD180_376 [Planctomycetota bacterium]
MNKQSALPAFLSIVSCAAVVFGVIQMRRLTTSVGALEDRLAKLEAPATAPAGGATPSDGPRTLEDVATELKALKAEVAAVKSAAESMEAAAASQPSKSVPAASEAQVKAAVEKALAEREDAKKKDRKEREKDLLKGGDLSGFAANQAVDMLAKELGLTDQQKAQVAEILKTQIATILAAWTDRKEGEDTKAKMEQLKLDTDTKIKGVLTPEQAVKYDDMQRNGGKGWGGGKWGGGGSEGK